MESKTLLYLDIAHEIDGRVQPGVKVLRAGVLHPGVLRLRAV